MDDKNPKAGLGDLVREADALITGKPLSRRGFAAASVAVGFAAAAGPVAASVITTDSDGLDAGMVSVSTQGGNMPAYRARPKGVAHPPVILVIQEIFGLHEWIKDVCRRFAKQGWYAIAGELYWRHGKASDYTDIGKLVSELVAKIPDGEVTTDLDAEVAFAESEGADTSIESGSETEPRSDEASTLRFGPAALDAGLIRRQA